MYSFDDSGCNMNVFGDKISSPFVLELADAVEKVTPERDVRLSTSNCKATTLPFLSFIFHGNDAHFMSSKGKFWV